MAIQAKAVWHRIATTSPLGSDLLITMGTNIVIAMLGFMTGIMAARLLGPEGRGELAAIQSWPLFIATIASLGLTDATVYFSARNPGQAGRYLASAVALSLLLAVPFIIIGYGLMPLLLAAQSGEVITAARWYLLLVPVYALTMFGHVFRGRNELAAWNITRLMPILAWFLILTIAALLGENTAQWLTSTQIIGFVLIVFLQFAMFRKRIFGLFRPAYSLWRPMLNYSLPLAFGRMPHLLNLRLDQMLMATLLAPHSLGLYAVAVAWSLAPLPLLSAIGGVIFPRVASQSSTVGGVKVLAQVTRLGVILATSLSLVLGIITPIAIPLLFGQEFTPATPAALILIVAGILYGLNIILQEGARGLDRTKMVLWSECAGLIVTILALVLLLRPFDLIGAALASLFGYAATTIVLVVQIKHVAECSTTQLLLPKREDISLIWKRLQTAIIKC